MAEGTARLNRQVVDNSYWQQAEAVGGFDAPPDPAPDATERHRRQRKVRRAIEADIVPRVFLGLERSPAAPAALVTGRGIGADEVLSFARLLLRNDDEAVVSAHLVSIMARGVSIAEIYLDLFQPASRQIGEFWADDRCSFVDVTLAVGTLQKMLRSFGPAFHKDGRPPEGDRQALLMPLPGDQHTFGLSMLTEFFRRAGWSVWNTPLGSFEAVGEAVRTAWFALVGFSASTDRRLDELARAITRIRRDSCNRHIGVLVGGPIFIAHPEFVGRVGADAGGESADTALARAEVFATRSAMP